MSFSTRNNPKLPQSTAGLTSLGAVGGARGTAAGGLRVLVEFLSTYNAGATKQLEADIDRIEKKSKFAAAEDEHRQKKLEQVRGQLHQVEQLRMGRLDAAARKRWKTEDELQGVRTRAGKAARQTAHDELQTMAQAQGLTQREIDLIQSRHTLRKREATILKQVDSGQQRAVSRLQQQKNAEAQLTKLQQVRANLAPKLTGLAIGAVGGLIGGAILGVGWQLADKAIQDLGTRLEDAINPAKKAKEAIIELGSAVLELAKANDISILEAARQKTDELGLSREKDAASTLAEFAATKKASDAIDEYVQFLAAGKDKSALATEAINKIKQALIEQGKAQNDAKIAQDKAAGVNTNTIDYYANLPFQIRTVNGEVVNLINGTDVLTLATQQWNEMLGISINTENASAQSKIRLANAAALLSVYQQTLNDALMKQVSIAGESFDTKIAALGDGASAKTKSLQKQIENAGSGGGDGGARRRELANIAEERALLLLKMRLKLLGTNINLEKYSGKFLLVAIEAKIAALQREGQEQQKINAMLDLRYRMSKTIERQQGESIGDFLERRAQEQRSLLSEEADMRRQDQIDALEDKKSNLEDQLALEALAERKREAMRTTGTGNHLANLRKQLAASQEADRKALEAKKKALEKQKKALEDAAKEAIALTSETSMKETFAAIAGMNNLSDVSKFSGRLSGLIRAKGAIQALVDGFGLPKWVAEPFLAKLNSMIESAESRMEQIRRNQVPRRGGGPVAFASGGVFELKNSRANFGNNVRTGEQGTELGVVLSHRVAAILQKQNRLPSQVGPFVFNNSATPLRDRYTFGKLVRENLEAALG